MDCIRFAAPIFSGDELDIDPSTFAPFSAATTRELLEVFDAEVARATQAIRQTNDPDATQPWRMLFNGRVIFTRPREAAFQDMTLSHLVHHRGQLSVYLRLLDIPVPPSYGPTADER